MAHPLGPRCSRTISLSDFPPTRAREASTSSKRTCRSTCLCRRGLRSTNNPAARRARRTFSRALSGAGIGTDKRSMSHSCATTWSGLPRRVAASWSRWYASGGSSNVSVAIIFPPWKNPFFCVLASLIVCQLGGKKRRLFGVVFWGGQRAGSWPSRCAPRRSLGDTRVVSVSWVLYSAG